MKGPLYLCADIGGTQIKTGLLDGAGRLAGAIHREDAQAGLPQQPLLDHIAACLLAPWPGDVPVAGVCLAMPGPCDYPAGRCWIEGLEKYGSLYGVDLRRELGARLAPALGPAGEYLLIQNDVSAFALGELRCGCAQGVQRGLFVCIGTGCGSAFTVGDALAPEGTPGVPPQGYLFPLPLAGKRVDDWLSRRGLQELSRRRLGRPLEGLPLAQLAQAGEPGALAVWEEFGQLLAQALAPVVEAFQPELLCLGGQVTASGALFLGPLQSACETRGVRLACTQETSLRAMQGALPCANQIQNQREVSL